MKNLILFCFVILVNFALAQEELGEGEIFMRSLMLEQDTLIESYEEYEVEALFSLLPFEDIKDLAYQERKAYYVDFTADWCLPCQMMNETVFKDYDVVSYTNENFYAVQLDMEDFDAIEMQAIYKVLSLPTILFFNYKGQLIDKTTGLQTGTLFLKKLKEVKSNL